MFKNTQDKLIEEFPFMQEKLVEKWGCDFGVWFWEDWRKKAKYPIACVHFRSDLMFIKVLWEHRQMLLDEEVYDGRMFAESRKTILVDVTKFTFFYELDKEPKWQGVGTVHKELSH